MLFNRTLLAGLALAGLIQSGLAQTSLEGTTFFSPLASTLGATCETGFSQNDRKGEQAQAYCLGFLFAVMSRLEEDKKGCFPANIDPVIQIAFTSLAGVADKAKSWELLEAELSQAFPCAPASTAKSAFPDDAYISEFWVVDKKGILDRMTKEYVVSIDDAVANIGRLTSGLSLKSVITEKSFGAKSPEAGALRIEHRLSKDGKLWIMIEEDRLDPATGEIRPQKGGAISVFTDMIADVEGVKAGSPLSAINIKKLCQSGEGTTSCQAPYSEFVEYGLSESDSMKSIATLRKKGSKAKIAYIKIGVPF